MDTTSEADWKHGGMGVIKWDNDKLKLTGCYVGASYRIVRAIRLEYGYLKRARGRQTRSYVHSYSVYVGRKELTRREALQRQLSKQTVRLGTRTWVLLNDQNIYITSGKLSDLKAWRDNLHLQIAQRIMQGQPAIDWQARSGWTSKPTTS